MVEGLVFVGGSWVFGSAHVFVVALEMLVKEMRVHELGVSPGSSAFVDHFSLVEELVAADCVESAEVTPLEAKQEILAAGLGLQFEPETVDIDLVTHHDESPHPGQRFKNIEGIEWDPKPLVVEESSLTFLSQVLIVLLRHEVDDWASQIHQPNGQK